MKNESFMPTPLVNILHVIMLGFVLLQINTMLPDIIDSAGALNSWNITEFLVNYQGGFVRRGLIGELLYMFTASTGIDCRWIILPFCVLTFILLSALLIVAFARRNLCWWILPLNFVLFGVDFLRKDSLMLLIAAMALMAYTRIQNIYKKLIVVNALLIFGLNVHECLFFEIGVFLGALIFLDKELGLSKLGRCLAVMPTFCMMACLSLFHGNEAVAHAVFDSWAKLYPEYFAEFLDSGVIKTLAWSTAHAMRYHFAVNFHVPDGIIYGYWEKPLLWLITFFLTARLPFILQKREKLAEDAGICAYLSVLVFQWCVMFPLFTVLHGDTSRALSYWSVSSLLVYLIVPDELIIRILPEKYKSFISMLQKHIYAPKWAYAAPVLMFFASASFFIVYWEDIYSHSVLGAYYILLQDILQWMLS